MSTSMLYHGWGLKDYTYRDKTEYEAGAIWIHIEKKPEKRRCPCCRSRDVVLAGNVTPLQFWRTVPIGRKQVWLIPHLHRILCCACGALVQEERLIAEPKKHYTHQLARYVLDLCRKMTMADVADHLGMTWDTVKEIIKNDLQDRSERIDWKNLQYIGIDEVSYRKGHKYLTVVLNLETGRVLYTAEGKKAEALAPFFKKIRRSRTKIKAIAMDMSNSYKLAVEEYYRRSVEIVYDRFHVMKLVNHELDEMRREEMGKALTEDAKKAIKGKRYLLLYGFENLTDDRKLQLLDLLRLNQDLSTAYIMKEQLRLFWEEPDREQGELFLKGWIAVARETGIRRLCKIAKTLERHWDGLVSYFDHPISTGPLEGINNAINVLKRKAYGYRDVEFLILRILFIHECKAKFSGS